jgi:hypothetical protein
MSKAGEEETIQQCDDNVYNVYIEMCENGRTDNYEELMNKSLDRRSELVQIINREQDNLLVTS